MTFNFNFLLKTSLFLIFFFISVFFLYSGYNKIINIQIDKALKFSIKKESSNLDEIYINNNKINNSEKITINEKELIITVKKNDTFSKLIDSYFPNKKEKNDLIYSVNKQFDLKKLNIGQKIYLYFKKNNNISKIVIPINFKTDLVIKKNDIGVYYVNIKIHPIKTELNAKKYTIKNSIFKDGRIANIPLNVLSEIIRIYSFDVDFQRDVQKGDELEVMYEVYFNEKRGAISFGKIQYINLNLQKNNLEYFLFDTDDGFSNYFNKNGKNFKKALMKTPLDGAQLSSSFGMRKHPILGYNKIHKGTDFAAPKGTPVFAAGDGIIEYARRNGSYGKYIRIRHNSSYKTSYAHLNSFNKGISKGIGVNQGQIIGFVGSTGQSSGAHLHYEVIFQNNQINPMTMKLPSGKVLKGKELSKFQTYSKKIYADFLFYLYE